MRDAEHFKAARAVVVAGWPSDVDELGSLRIEGETVLRECFASTFLTVACPLPAHGLDEATIVVGAHGEVIGLGSTDDEGRFASLSHAARLRLAVEPV